MGRYKNQHIQKKIDELLPLIPKGKNNGILAAIILRDYEKVYDKKWSLRGKGNRGGCHKTIAGRVRSLISFIKIFDEFHRIKESKYGGATWLYYTE